MKNGAAQAFFFFFFFFFLYLPHRNPVKTTGFALLYRTPDRDGGHYGKMDKLFFAT